MAKLRFYWRVSIPTVGALMAGALCLLAAVSCSAQSAPAHSRFFATAAEESFSTYQLPGDGDLWPSCWAADGNLYAANGDGMAFDPYTKPVDFKKRYDMAVSRISGMPPHLTGKTIARDVGTNWGGPKYNRKPTGMLCIHGVMYLAYQNLAKDNFNDAPAASIAKSRDGVNWVWDKSAPMFGAPGKPESALAYKFTTIFFLDFGKDSKNAMDGYVYAYGMDHNWRGQQALYLARVLDNEIMRRSAWEFYSGVGAAGVPQWSKDITKKQPVLEDHRLLYPSGSAGHCGTKQPVIGQGGVVYDKPLRRFLFTSWSCATHQMYEAPEPWGPWTLFLSKDFGPFFTSRNYGMYGTNVPSKFISADGKTLYLQSNIWWTNHGKSVWRAYTFALRRLYLEPFEPATPANRISGSNLALAPGARAISKSTHFGSLCGLNCSDAIADGDPSASEDDFDGSPKKADWWGYQWPQPYNMDEVVYVTGKMFPNGGWFKATPRVQVLQDFRWVDVAGVRVSPEYPANASAGDHTTYVFRFPRTWGYGVRIFGSPGGSGHFSSIARLRVYFKGELAK